MKWRRPKKRSKFITPLSLPELIGLCNRIRILTEIEPDWYVKYTYYKCTENSILKGSWSMATATTKRPRKKE